MATVYLHIGTMKTGTSALQSFLNANREVLEKQGYAYPRMDVGLPRKYDYRNGRFLVHHLGPNDKEKGNTEEIIKNAFEQIADTAKNFDNIILSDETIWHYCGRDSNFWSDLVENFTRINCEVKVIFYLRRQDLYVESLYNQMVKLNRMLTKTFEDYIEGSVAEKWLHYYRYIKAIEQHIKKENIMVRVYEKDQFEGEGNTIFSDFLKCVGLTYNETYKVERPAVNLGLQGNYIELKRIINGLPEYRELNDFMSKPFRDASAAKNENMLHGKVSMFSKEQQMEYMAQFEEDNRKIAQEYLGREDGILFREPMGDLPTWKLDEEALYQDIMISVTETFCYQERRLRDAERRIQMLEERVQSLEEELLSQDGLRNQVTSMYRSLIFRGYRKARKVMRRK